jgi:DNA-binding response OmpR family regulator
MSLTEKSRATILLVGDDLAVAELLRAQLTARGYAVCHVMSASEAEAVVDEIAPTSSSSTSC